MTVEQATRRPRIIHHSAGTVIIADGGCLVLRRAHQWVPPKGHLEERERPEDAAVREAREETGLAVAVDGYAGMTRYSFRSSDGQEHTKRVDWYVAHPTGGDLRPERAFAEAVYLPVDVAIEQLTFEADRDIVRASFGLAGLTE